MQSCLDGTPSNPMRSQNLKRVTVKNRLLQFILRIKPLKFKKGTEAHQLIIHIDRQFQISIAKEIADYKI